MEILDFLLKLPSAEEIDWTEADTRAQFIDPVLQALGWVPNEIKREPYAGWSDSKGFIDYLLLVDDRPMLVLEAKKVGRSFKIPANLSSQRTTSFRKLRATASSDLRESLDQCLRYTQHTGALYACATNGSDWVFFKPSHPFRSLPDAKVIIFNGVDQLIKRVDEFVDLISSSGIQQGRAEKALLGRDIQVPTFAKRLKDAFPYVGSIDFEEEEYSNILDQMLSHYLVELNEDDDFMQCYIPARGNKPTSGTLESLISDRIRATKNASAQGALEFGSEMSQRPGLPNGGVGRTVILHGEVGVGKTSFLRHCELILDEEKKLEEAVWARVDLLPFQDRYFDPDDVKEMLNLICEKIQLKVSTSTEGMSGSYDPDAWNHLRDIYNHEVRKFQKARYPDSDDSDDEFLKMAREYVWNLREKDPQEHLIRVIRWLTVNCCLPVIIVLDNSDQLGLEFQEFLYKLSETIDSSTSAVVILVMRTEALSSHVIRDHSIASVREQFLVEKAPLPTILRRRFANLIEKLPDVYAGSTEKAARDRITVLMETLEYEAKLGSDAFHLIDAAGNGNLRDNLRAVSAVFRSSPKAMDRLVHKQSEEGRVRLGLPQVLRALMKDDLRSADALKLIPNVFDVDSQVTIPYSLGIRELQQVRSKGANAECTVASVLNDFSLAGVDRSIAERTLVRMRANRLLTVRHMLPELREVDNLYVTRLGKALLDIILREESYFSGSAFNTYIYRKDVYLQMRSAWTSGGGEYHLKFKAIGRHFIEMVVDDDDDLRRRIDLSLLEPSIGQALPGLLDGRMVRDRE